MASGIVFVKGGLEYLLGREIHFHKLEQRWPTKKYLPIILHYW